MSSLANKILVIGLDGASLELIDPWIKENKLPNIAKIIKNGVSGNLKSTLPPYSAPAWSSIITGKNPGKHGVFGFTMRKSDDYDVMPVNSSLRKSKDLWEILNEHGKKVIVINVPLTYPTRKVNGFLITGLMTPRGANDFTYPDSLKEEIRKIAPEYKIEPDEYYVKGREDIFLKDLYTTTENLTKTTLYFIKKHKWDFFMVVFTGTDRIQHALWHCMDSNHPAYNPKNGKKFGDAILKFYQKVDDIVGKMLDRIDENTTIIILSDHGAQPVHRLLHISNLLMKIGLLKLKKGIYTRFKYLLFKLSFTPLNLYKLLLKLGLGKLRQTIQTKTGKKKIKSQLQKIFLSLEDIDWSRTKAYAGGQNQVWVNLRGREPKGIIKPGVEYEEVRSMIIDEFKKFKDPQGGQEIFQLVLKKEDAYKGEYLGQAPDIVVLPNSTYSIFFGHEFGSNLIIDWPFDYTYSDHSMNGILTLTGPFIKKGKTLNGEVVDVAPTILYLLQIPIQSDMDGKILTEAIEPTYLRLNPIRREQVTPETDLTRYQFSREEEEEVKARLRALGYLS